MGYYYKTCRTVLGGCGKSFKTTHKKAVKCEECQHKTYLKGLELQKQKRLETKKLLNELPTLIKCGVCGRTISNKAITQHLINNHPERYKTIMANYYKDISKSIY